MYNTNIFFEVQAEETRAKEKMAFFKNKVLYCEKTTVLTLLVQLEKNHKSFMSKLKLFSNSSIIPQSCCPGN